MPKPIAAKYELLSTEERQTINCFTIKGTLVICLLFATASLTYCFWKEVKIFSSNNSSLVPLNDLKEDLFEKDLVGHRLQLYTAALLNSEYHDKIPNVVPKKAFNFIQENKKDEDMKLVCYYSIPENLNSTEELLPEFLDPFLCTHIIVAFARVRNCSLQPNKPYDIEVYEKVVSLKLKNPLLKVTLCIGGGSMSPGGFSDMVASHHTRKLFIEETFFFVKKYGFDGIDLDWEFPAWQSNPMEKEYFSSLLHDFRKEIERKNISFLLTVAVAAPGPIVDAAYDVPILARYADFVSIMAYDYHFYVWYLPITGINAPLYAQSGDKGYFTTLNINWSVNYWEYKGMPKSKMVIGLPTYGHSFTLLNSENNDLRAPASGIGAIGNSGFVSYSQVCEYLQSGGVNLRFDQSSKSPFTFKNKEWISYDDKRSLEFKAEYVLKGDYAGAMVLSLSVDDFSGKCSSGGITFPLTRHIKLILRDEELLQMEKFLTEAVHRIGEYY